VEFTDSGEVQDQPAAPPCVKKRGQWEKSSDTEGDKSTDWRLEVDGEERNWMKTQTLKVDATRTTHRPTSVLFSLVTSLLLLLIKHLSPVMLDRAVISSKKTNSSMKR
jgi:hypothetical protein